MTSTTIEAIYEKGVLRLSRPIDLADGTRVEVVVTPRPADGPSLATLPRQKRTPTEIVAEIAALAVENPAQEFSGRDHDSILYGEHGAR